MSALAPSPPPPPPPLPSAMGKRTSQLLRELDDLLARLDKETKMKLGVENMLEVYLKDKKRKKDLEAQLESCNVSMDEIVQRIEYIRTNAGASTAEVAQKLKEHSYSGNALFSSAITSSTSSSSRTRGKPRSNSSPNIKGKQKASQENISFPDDDAWPIGKRLHHIITQLRIDEWKAAKPGTSADALAVKESKLSKLDTLLRILKNTTDIEAHYPKRNMVACLRQCIAGPNREVRVMSLRNLRHLVEGPADVKIMMDMQIDIFIVRALSRDPNNHEPEREQSLKLVRSFIEYNGLRYINQGIVRAIVAIAEQTDCRLRNISLETLAELAILDIGLTVRAGGVRVLMQALLDGQLNMAEVLVHALVYVLDTPGRRRYLRPGVELEMIIAPFTETGKGTNFEERLKNSARVTLRFPVPETQKIVLDMFFNVFRVKLPKDYNSFLAGRQHTVHIGPGSNNAGADQAAAPLAGRSGTSRLGSSSNDINDLLMKNFKTADIKNMANKERSTATNNAERLNMLDHHLCIILIIFIDADILMALVDMVKSDDVYISRKATLLIGEILQLSTRLLPIMMGIQVQSLPKLFALASNFEDEQVRHNATTALAHIDRLTRARARYMSQTVSSNASLKGEGRLVAANNTARTQEMVHEVKLKIGMAIDDTHFRQLLMDTQVLHTKDYTKWSWESISELLQGPLLNPRRMEEAMRGKKFIKRLLAFYRPFAHKFSDANASKANIARHLKTGCVLIQTLLGNPDGVRYLGENKLLGQIAEALSELDPLNGDPETEPIFSKERMENTLSRGYFTLLGVMSKHKEGVRLMEKFKIFSLFYQLSELRNRDDLKIAIITNMDYTLDGHPRVLLSKIMTSGYNPIRLFATQYLSIIMQRSESEYNGWIIRLLLTQLYDTHLDVCQMAVNLLDEACENQANLELLVKYRPSLGHLGEIGNPLLLRFLSTSTGFRYLYALGYVQKEMDDWFELELSLARALANTPERKDQNPFEERIDSESNFETLQPGDGLSPPHFYGELTKTEDGCGLLREKGHFQYFANYIRNYSLENQNPEVFQQLKAVLWAVGSIGATKNGLPFLEEEDIVKDITQIAENSEVLSLKGTCYYVLGLVTKTQQGVELLGELNWDGVTSSNGVPEGLCVPQNLELFLSIRNWKYTPALSDPPVFPSILEKDAITLNILKNIGDMSNHILANEASKNLAKLRYKCPDHFKRVDLFYCVCQLLGSYHFRTPVRKYILEIFEMRFTPELLQELDEVAAERILADNEEAAKENEKEDTQDQQQQRQQQQQQEEQQPEATAASSVSGNGQEQQPQASSGSVVTSSLTDEKKALPHETQKVPQETLEPVCKQIGFNIT
ncbi:Rapamycin-insensitive companion of mTOR, middle domain-containing protein [Zychaea mexicana]|uniref:Rapamycin-insensitive companion of mTOR, middle domain-containing protein n=1 Tax=Zychaea mexicana TaxID=64656 RepID=UPI0022FE495D|nr:Rapamycin-insensitive companion of mTOR, middle domain-containing protein [Zychaea mexicana]KAI9498276.1 Rapamycin-insensitive companion of mTOR, middle domain-containing protein [Zychaea mexicana]